MQIVKRNGKKEEYSLKKIETSISNSAHDIDYTLTESDLKMITGDIDKILNSLASSEGLISTYEVRGVIYRILIDNKFMGLCRSYMNL